VHRWLIVAGALVPLAGFGGMARAEPGHAARMKAIVREWSRHLNAGDNAAEAGLFRLPATMIQGQYAYKLVTRKQIAQWHAGLPCSGTVVSISVKGNVATAVFRLGDRKASKCDAPGTLAAAAFLIVNGKIVAWEQVPPPTKPGAA